MELILKVTKCPPGSDMSGVTVTVGKDGATIGRATTNSLVLPDANRYVSSDHGRIEFDGSRYSFIDISTNGSYLNHLGHPLIKGHPEPLKNGDRLMLGQYELKVELAEPSDDRTQMFAPDSDIEATRISSDIASQTAMSDLDDWIGSGEEPWPVYQHAANTTAVPPEQVEAEMQDDLEPQSEADMDDGILDAEIIEDVEAPTLVNHAAPRDAEAALEDEFEPAAEPAAEEAATAPEQDEQTTQFSKKDMTPDWLTQALGMMTLTEEAHKQVVDKSMDLLREAVEGVLSTLREKQSLKNELRINQTQIRVAENNPLKFSPTPEVALENLLLKQGTTYLSADEAMKEAFADIRDHQRALYKSVRGLYTRIIKSLDPEQIVKHIDNKHGQPWIGGNHRKYWDEYLKAYNKLRKDEEQAFQGKFSEDFANSYEFYFNQLKAQRKNNKADEDDL
ncbi:type VI secretion system-associated FHA domain protein TagH [Hahella sp. CR1]|uniref:type VI secretion system-associated FHA domain protein TagH n=1 Tax=Hahella sp. CR1 TaxID=2992807 RepID=UPI002441F41C|nr:type VI secretion system-associated FHA domain protein TagH [Hahella sp. CR1]MDG9667273.1 type VI secretion system-associated FHA domain protein TagH [Hahella sp. CR1]